MHQIYIKFAKRNRSDKKSIGNIIDTAMQGMNYGQTNGIPQGSVLMDFIAEMANSLNLDSYQPNF
jgi:hypothetical protein